MVWSIPARLPGTEALSLSTCSHSPAWGAVKTLSQHTCRHGAGSHVCPWASPHPAARVSDVRIGSDLFSFLYLEARDLFTCENRHGWHGAGHGTQAVLPALSPRRMPSISLMWFYVFPKGYLCFLNVDLKFFLELPCSRDGVFLSTKFRGMDLKMTQTFKHSRENPVSAELR